MPRSTGCSLQSKFTALPSALPAAHSTCGHSALGEECTYNTPRAARTARVTFSAISLSVPEVRLPLRPRSGGWLVFGCRRRAVMGDYAPDQQRRQDPGRRSCGRPTSSRRKSLCSVNRSSSDSETSMAVRDALLTLLTIGPAYGFQLHGGLETRTGGRRRVNVGQPYATLGRLTKQRLIAPAGTTDDGLPLHALPPAGVAAADAWLGGADASGADAWDETVDR